MDRGGAGSGLGVNPAAAGGRCQQRSNMTGYVLFEAHLVTLKRGAE
jgi:hypothetical protein